MTNCEHGCGSENKLYVLEKFKADNGLTVTLEYRTLPNSGREKFYSVWIKDADGISHIIDMHPFREYMREKYHEIKRTINWRRSFTGMNGTTIIPKRKKDIEQPIEISLEKIESEDGITLYLHYTKVKGEGGLYSIILKDVSQEMKLITCSKDIQRIITRYDSLTKQINKLQRVMCHNSQIYEIKRKGDKKKMSDILQITKDNVLKAIKECPEVQKVFEKLFPNMFDVKYFSPGSIFFDSEGYYKAHSAMMKYDDIPRVVTENISEYLQYLYIIAGHLATENGKFTFVHLADGKVWKASIGLSLTDDGVQIPNEFLHRMIFVK